MPAVESTRPLRLAPGGGMELIVTNRGSNSVFYGQEATVSSSNKTGTLASGASLTLTKGYVWVIAEKTPAVLDLREIEAGIGSNNFGEGQSLTVFTPDPGVQILPIQKGSSATPDKTYSPLVHVSRTLEIPEASFSGDGAPGLAGIYAVTKALAASEGQAVGIFGGAITEGTNVGSHSSADAVGGYFVGKATSVSTRSGIGGFFNGRREATGAFTTGIEVVSDNETAENGKHEPTGASSTKGIWLHAVGEAGSGTGLQLGYTGRSFEVGIGFNVGSTSAADIRTDSEANFGIRVRGTHAGCGISVKEGSGVVLLGSSTEIAKEAGAILETPFLRINATGIHLNGGTPVAIKAAGAETTAAIWARLKELGVCT